jgi:guanylate kinase
MVTRNEFLEHATVLGRHSYGTPRAQVEAELAAGRDVAFDIDWQGHRQLRAALPGDVVGVFILPPSLDALESRLRGRGDEADAEIARRMARARDEISHWAEFDYVLINDIFEEALSELRAILHAARSATRHQSGLSAFIASLGT